MTPGQEALAEIARLEAAYVYSRTVREDRDVPPMYAPRLLSVPARDQIERAIAGGASVREVMDRLGVSYGLVKSVKDSMRGAA